MENFFSRYKNPLVLMLVLFIQVVGLATQVKRSESAKPGGGGGPRLIRVWTVSIITPFEKAFSGTGHFFRRTWHSYVDLHDARKESRDLQDQIARMKMEEVSLREEAAQAKRLQALLDFKERYIGQTVAAQVIGTSGSEQSRIIYIDKGSHSGIKVDMPVITPDGIVGKIKEVFKFTSQVLLVSDHDSGAGVVLQNSRLQGILRGTPQGQLIVTGLMSDEKIEPGEHVVTSGGDRIYPKGVPVGVVTNSVPDVENDPFLKVTVKPAANLNKLEEVLVVTSMVEESPSTTASGPQRAADILAQRLPSAKVEDKSGGGKPATGTATPAPTATAPGGSIPGGRSSATLPALPSATKTGQKKAATGIAPGESPSATPASGTAVPGTKKLPTDQKKPPSAGTPANALATPINAVPANQKKPLGTGTPASPAVTPAQKKPPSTATPANPAATPNAGAPANQKKALSAGTPANPPANANQKKPLGTGTPANPSVTPAQKKPPSTATPAHPAATPNAGAPANQKKALSTGTPGKPAAVPNSVAPANGTTPASGTPPGAGASTKKKAPAKPKATPAGAAPDAAPTGTPEATPPPAGGRLPR